VAALPTLQGKSGDGSRFGGTSTSTPLVPQAGLRITLWQTSPFRTSRTTTGTVQNRRSGNAPCAFLPDPRQNAGIDRHFVLYVFAEQIRDLVRIGATDADKKLLRKLA